MSFQCIAPCFILCDFIGLRMSRLGCVGCACFHGSSHRSANSRGHTGIKKHGHVSAAKKDVWHTSVLFTGTAKGPFSTPHISITSGQISINITYCMPSIYKTLHTKLKKIGLAACEMYVSLNCNFHHIFLLCTN